MLDIPNIEFSDLSILVRFAKVRAEGWLYDGRESAATMLNIRRCTYRYRVTADLGAVVLYTRDVGHHSSGWWKNPDYERCFHLSLSYRALPADSQAPHDRAISMVIARAFFGDDAKLAWIEGPYSPGGKQAEVWHYRLFCDPAWKPFLPRGEVYSKDWTPADWRSFSEIHGYTPDPADAPWLLAAGKGD
jgi:hypothetical protein